MDKDSNTEAEDDLVYGIIEEAQPNTRFLVSVEGEPQPVLAYLSGRMRRFRIRVLVGDKVGLVIDPYGGQARITKRL